MGSIVVPFCDAYLGSYKVAPNRNYFGAYGLFQLVTFIESSESHEPSGSAREALGKGASLVLGLRV